MVELKYGKGAGAAIQQIKDRNYTQALEGYAGEILLVGVNYDKGNLNKPHSCVIEKVVKEGTAKDWENLGRASGKRGRIKD